MNMVGPVRCTLVVLLMAPVSWVAAQTHGWPVEPADQEHPIGNNLGEFWIGSQGPYQHTGLDILATPYPDPAAPWVVATVAGEVTWVNDSDMTGLSNLIRVKDANGIEYRYQHLAFGTFLAKFAGPFLAGRTVIAGEQLARVAPFGCAAYSHLHYDLLQDTAKYLNPLARIVPNPDGVPPRVLDIGLAARGSLPWSEFAPPAKNACTVVNGNVDIIAQLNDRDDAGSTLIGAGNVGVHHLRWRVCPDGTPVCSNWNDTHPFDDMPKAWDRSGNTATPKQFSTTPDWVSTADACSNEVDKTFSVVTGLASGWNTTTSPDGSYTVSVEATDFSGNKTTSTAHACVQNGTACTTDLTIRDGDNDHGATPFLDSPFWLSPDIKVNRGTVDEDRNIKVGRVNVVEVQVQNTGSCTLPVATTYNVCLGWSPPSDSVPHPLPASQTVDCQPQVVAGADWLPGTGRLTSFSWTPAAGSLPLGDNSLVAWSDLPADPVQSTPSAPLDNNRAQRNITFAASPEPLPPSDVIVE